MASSQFHCLLVTTLALGSLPIPCAGETVGPLQYEDFADSPYYQMRHTPNFYLEDFTNGVEAADENPFPAASHSAVKLTTPGSYGTRGSFLAGQRGVLYAFGFWDRVNGLDRTRLSFEFDAMELGWLPQAVGFLTSNAAPVTIEFYDGSGGVIDTLSTPEAPLPDMPDLTGLGDTLRTYARPRFFGAVHLGGISRVDINAAMRSTFVDDFQYGRLIPEPSAASIALCSLLLCALSHTRSFQGSLRPFFAQRY